MHRSTIRVRGKPVGYVNFFRKRKKYLLLVAVLLVLWFMWPFSSATPSPLLELCSPSPSAISRSSLRESSRFDAVKNYDGTRKVKVRFLTTHTKVNLNLFNFLASARLAGVPVDVVGLGWTRFSLPRRQKLIVEYIDATNLNDDDVVVMLDSDMVFTGEDLYPLLQMYVSMSPASPAETDPRSVRMNEQIAPVMFSTECFCWSPDAVRRISKECEPHYLELENLLKEWAPTEGLQYDVNGADRKRNPNVFLNNGLTMGRVWALRRLWKAYYTYMTQVPSKSEEGYYVSDQGVYSALLWNLTAWEVTSGLLSATDRRGKEGPYHMIGGMIGLDYQSKFALATIALTSNLPYPLDYNGYLFSETTASDVRQQVVQELRSNAYRTITAAGANMALGALTSFIPNTVPRDSIPNLFGIPVVNKTRPALWHFNGGGKTALKWMLNFLPTVIVLEALPSEWIQSRKVFYAAAPHKVWVVQSTSEAEDYPLRRQPESDLDAEELCRLVT